MRAGRGHRNPRALAAARAGARPSLSALPRCKHRAAGRYRARSRRPADAGDGAADSRAPGRSCRQHVSAAHHAESGGRIRRIGHSAQRSLAAKPEAWASGVCQQHQRLDALRAKHRLAESHAAPSASKRYRQRVLPESTAHPWADDGGAAHVSLQRREGRRVRRAAAERRQGRWCGHCGDPAEPAAKPSRPEAQPSARRRHHRERRQRGRARAHDRSGPVDRPQHHECGRCA